MDTSISDDIWGTAPSYFCIVARRTFWTVLDLYCCVMGEHGRQRTVMDTSLSDIIEVHGILPLYGVECMGSSVIIICKKS